MKLTNCVNFMLNVGFEDVDTYYYFFWYCMYYITKSKRYSFILEDREILYSSVIMKLLAVWCMKENLYERGSLIM